MNEKGLQTLEYKKVLQQLKSFTVTKIGGELVSNLTPETAEKKISRALLETEDAVKVLRLRGGLPVPKLENIRPHLKRIDIGADLNGVELAQITRVLTSTKEVADFLHELAEQEQEFHYLYEWMDQLFLLPELTRDLKRSIDEDGQVNDEASSLLKQLRQQIKRSEQNVREQLDSFIRGGNNKYLSDNIITIRNDRYVIPVKAEYRGVFGGVVHDQSSSGQTLFIEPKSVVELNNRLRQQQIAERDEVLRILSELSARLVPYVREIRHNAEVLGQMDLMNAKAKYGRDLKATIPALSLNKEVRLLSARHPLLNQDTAVANDLFIGKDFQAVVITGPNTGGKTITLKTLGLLQMMGQSGLALPVAENSQIGIFQEIYADIGDEQSIEQNLSTFSSHMTNIVKILAKADEESLVLFDELGAGTDPQEGAALAISILDFLGSRSSYVMATTHYPELKVYGYNRPNTINASMEFDVDTLSPTYHLLIGVPGRSNAFEISKRLGLNPEVIESAKQILDGESQDLNEMIADLENQRKMTELEYLEMRQHTTEAEKLHLDLQKAYEEFFTQREDEMKKAQDKANALVAEAQEKAETIITELRNKQLAGGNQGIKEHEFIAAKSALAALATHHAPLEKNKVLRRAKNKKKFKVGDEVISATYGQRGVLLAPEKNDSWQVQMGILKMSLPESDLTLAQAEKEPTRRIVNVQSASASHVATQLDLRGKRYDEALEEVDQYLDAAILAGYPQVTIVHGKGTGALRKGITDYLKNHRSVAKYEFAPNNQGGNGATIVYFK
ncbi:endonuclease MutS2 [Enterococcus timonensis]|uniref:endonuclease MutS2 n=1 Tax=Enterococcus timonensis TaxID=1852364 RepID=UPI0008DAF487|nr:endonuclease MutS2 [Enterococcus timonensis]